MERQFDFLMPSVNFFGPGVIAKIGDRAKMLNMNKVLVVTGATFARLRMAQLTKPWLHWKRPA